MVLNRITPFFALSRTPHGILDVATPAMAALLWMGRMPSPGVVLLGLLTAFAGYTAVYALNDLVDYRTDKIKMTSPAPAAALLPTGDLDAVFLRHPLAQGVLAYDAGLLWAGFWAAIALLGAYLLNPACALIFIVGCLLEILYCRLLQVSPWRFLVSGVVKTLGGLAAVLAVAPEPPLFFMIALFGWVFLWEIGGQNVPNDWIDEEEDRYLNARTLPVLLGRHWAAVLVVTSLVSAVLAGFLLFWLSPGGLGTFEMTAMPILGLYLLLLPACRLYRSRSGIEAARLFNRASYYPLGMLLVVLVRMTM